MLLRDDGGRLLLWRDSKVRRLLLLRDEGARAARGLRGDDRQGGGARSPGRRRKGGGGEVGRPGRSIWIDFARVRVVGIFFACACVSRAVGEDKRGVAHP